VSTIAVSLPALQPRTTPAYVLLGNNLSCIQCPETAAQGFYTQPIPLPYDLDRSRPVHAAIAFGKRTGTPPAGTFGLKWFVNWTAAVGTLVTNDGQGVTWPVPPSWTPLVLEQIDVPAVDTPLIPPNTLPKGCVIGFAAFRDPANVDDTYPTAVVLALQLLIRYTRLCAFCGCC